MVGVSLTPSPTPASAWRPAGSALKEHRLPSRPCSGSHTLTALRNDDGDGAASPAAGQNTSSHGVPATNAARIVGDRRMSAEGKLVVPSPNDGFRLGSLHRRPHGRTEVLPNTIDCRGA